jgi:hypothetical protein
MKVGDKVWCYVGGFWVKADVVNHPWDIKPKRGSVFVQFADDQDIYRYNKEFVRKFL